MRLNCNNLFEIAVTKYLLEFLRHAIRIFLKENINHKNDGGQNRLESFSHLINLKRKSLTCFIEDS